LEETSLIEPQNYEIRRQKLEIRNKNLESRMWNVESRKVEFRNLPTPTAVWFKKKTLRNP
jgi:hypothetical protein